MYKEFIKNYKNDILAENFVLMSEDKIKKIQSDLLIAKIAEKERKEKEIEDRIKLIKEDFNVAMSSNSLKQLERFLKKYDDEDLADNFIDLVEDKMDLLEREEKERERKIEEKRKKKLEQIKNDYNLAIKSKNPIQYENFLDKYINDEHAVEFSEKIKSSLKELKKEIAYKKIKEKENLENSYQKTLQVNTIESYDNFFEKNKLNVLAKKYLKDVKIRREQLKN